MTVAALLDAAHRLTFARVVQVNRAPGGSAYAVCHQIDLESFQPVKPTQLVYIGGAAIEGSLRCYRIGPFFTPYNMDLVNYGTPKQGDIVTGITGVNAKGAVFTSILPDRWARPVANFFYYLLNAPVATGLYENYDPAMRMLLLNRLTVRYPVSGAPPVMDERLYDLLLLVLFDDTDGLVNMCRLPDFRPAGGRVWDLLDPDQSKHMNAYCTGMMLHGNTSTVHVPSVPDFVEEAAFLVKNPELVGYFRTALRAYAAEEGDTFHPEIHTWLADKDCMSPDFIQKLIS